MANPEVKILLTVVDHASQKIKGIGSSFAEIAGPAKLAGAAIAAIGTAIKLSIDATVKYANQIREIQRITGGTSEEASKLIQAADDVFISFDQLAQGLKASVRAGFEPTIDGLAQMSKEFQALPAGTDRAAWAMEHFGRAGTDLMPLLEAGPDKIREMGRAAEEAGLVMSQAGVDGMVKYQEAIDDVGDKWEGLKLKVGGGAALWLVQVDEMFKQMGEDIKNYGKDGEEGINDVVYAAFEANNALRELDSTTDDLTASMGHSKDAMSQADAMAGQLADTIINQEIEANREAREAAEEHARGLEEAARKADELRKALLGVSAATLDLDTNLGSSMGSLIEKLDFKAMGGDKIQKAFGQVTAMVDLVGDDTIKKWTTDLIVGLEVASKAAGQQTKSEGLQNIMDQTGLNWDQAKAAWKDSDLQGTLDDINSKAQELADQVGTTGEASTTATDAMKTGLEEAKTATEEEKTAWEEVKTAIGEAEEAAGQFFGGLKNACKQAATDIGAIVTAFNALDGKTAHMTIDISVTGAGASLLGTGGGQKVGGGGPPIKREAAGGPVGANSIYLVGERGPELFIPNSSGNIVPNDRLTGGSPHTPVGGLQQYNVFNISGGNQNPAAIADAVMGRLAQLARSAGMAGTGYTGV